MKGPKFKDGGEPKQWWLTKETILVRKGDQIRVVSFDLLSDENRMEWIKKVMDMAEWLVNYYEWEKREGKRKSAHDETHMLNVAKAAAEYVKYKKPRGHGRILSLATLAGLTHDLVRAPKEVNRELGTSDGYITAEVLRYLHDGKVKNPKLLETVKEIVEKNYKLGQLGKFLQKFEKKNIEIVARVIERNEGKVEDILREVEGLDNEMEKLVSLALMYADKGVEGIGPRVVYRRAAFVSGERFFKGDLQNLKENLEKVLGKEVSEEEAMVAAFVFESFRRIFSSKSLDALPDDEMWKKVKESRDFEMDVFKGLAGWLMDRWGVRDYEELLEIAKKAQYPVLHDKDYPKVKEQLKKVDEKRPQANEDAVHMVLAIAYGEFQPEKSIEHLKQVKDPRYSSLAKTSTPAAKEELLREIKNNLVAKMM
ncbi:MAG: hypothetical protein GXN92_00330 [Candidatus Micrarchaeota archaeon]|nr:hypothetical protein [Candidatus Micrarchaeota archaeon]